jgi:hypothetical protein
LLLPMIAAAAAAAAAAHDLGSAAATHVTSPARRVAIVDISSLIGLVVTGGRRLPAAHDY